MILVINGTNRPGNKSQIVSKYCFEYLSKNFEEQIKFFNLEDINNFDLSFNIYNKSDININLEKIQDELFIPSNDWIIISPEYNGSFPGVLKFFIDALSSRKYDFVFKKKNIGLIGTSDGRDGNLRGMDHLTSFLNYLKITVYHNKLPISSLSNLIKNDELTQDVQLVLNQYLDDYMTWKMR
ncbi:MAG: hypothetical protein RLZZ546_1352 [Bacteroidota bacterium]